MRKSNNRFVQRWRIRSGHEKPASAATPPVRETVYTLVPGTPRPARVPRLNPGAEGPIFIKPLDLYVDPSPAPPADPSAEPSPRKRRSKRAESEVLEQPSEVEPSPPPADPTDSLSLEDLERLTAPSEE